MAMLYPVYPVPEFEAQIDILRRFKEASQG
jgi:hypothetical protein